MNKICLIIAMTIGACSQDNSKLLPPAGDVRSADFVPLTICQSQFNPSSPCAMERCPLEPPTCATDEDQDCDDVLDYGVEFDNCTNFCNPGQENADGDYMGDVCDPCPNDPGNDIDKDGLCADVDNCPHISNASQTNADGDGYGDACDVLPNLADPEATIAALDTRIDALEEAQTTITALQADVVLLVTALTEIREKYPEHFHGLLGLNGDPVGTSGDLSYSLPGD